MQTYGVPAGPVAPLASAYFEAMPTFPGTPGPCIRWYSTRELGFRLEPNPGPVPSDRDRQVRPAIRRVAPPVEEEENAFGLRPVRSAPVAPPILAQSFPVLAIDRQLGRHIVQSHPFGCFVCAAQYDVDSGITTASSYHPSHSVPSRSALSNEIQEFSENGHNPSGHG